MIYLEFTLDRYNVSVSIYNKKNVMPLIVINSYKKEFDNLKINSSFILYNRKVIEKL